MRCGFWPRDRDRTAERMEGVWMGFGPLWRGVGLQDTRDLYGSPVNRWCIKRTPNGTKFDRRSTSGVPGLLGKSHPIPRMFNTAHEKRQKGAPEDVGVSECKTGNGKKMLGCMRRTRMQMRCT